MTADDVVSEVEGLAAMVTACDGGASEAMSVLADGAGFDWDEAQEALEAWLWEVRASKTDGGEDGLDVSDRDEIRSASFVMLAGFLAGVHARQPVAA